MGYKIITINKAYPTACCRFHAFNSCSCNSTIFLMNDFHSFISFSYIVNHFTRTVSRAVVN